MSNVQTPDVQTGTKKLLEVNGLKKYFPIEKGFLRRVVGHVKAVDDVNLYINEGETLGLVGESGCGKTTLGRCIVRAIEPTAGEILLRVPARGSGAYQAAASEAGSEEGSAPAGGADSGSPQDRVVDLVKIEKRELRYLRRHMHMIFQDPYSSLDPRMTVLDIIAEPLIYHSIARGNDLIDRVKSLMQVVGLEVKHLKRYPHAFSGGQRQRIGIARSLAPNPKLIVCDEAVSALDVSIQAQILNLLQDLQKEFNLTYLFIAHDLSVVEHISDRVAVMYVGKMVEMAETEELFINP
jgi:peptide/nickel transport system ATP-binding protein